MFRKLAYFFLIALLASSSFAAGKAKKTKTKTKKPAEAAVPAAPAEPLTVEQMKQTIVDLETTAGTISLEFYPEHAPNHVRNFIERSRSGFYDGTNFHRVIPDFMIQGGDPNTRSGPRETWGMGGAAETLQAEFNDIPHERGILSMARKADPHSATSQFFIVVGSAPYLNRHYTAFGRVIGGMEAADKIATGRTNPDNDQPYEPVVIKRARVRSVEAKQSK